jgi:hypothetical protein
MRLELPFSISFELPEGWKLVPPESCGQPDDTCVAVRERNASGPIATNFVIRVSGNYGGPVDVAALAAGHLAKLQSQYPVTVLKHDVMPEESPTETAQLLQIEYPVGESTVTLKQIQIINAFSSVDDADAVALLQLVMTCPADIFDQAGPEFGQFVASISSR